MLNKIAVRIVVPVWFAWVFSVLLSGPALANNLQITQLLLTEPNSTAKTAKIQFDIAWSNSWRNNTNYDAAWVFAKYSRDSGATWSPVTLKFSGTNPAGFGQSAGTALNIVVPSDKKGAFLCRAANGSGQLTSQAVALIWDWDADGLSSTDPVSVRVFAIEMVYIPSGVFYAGDNATAAASLKRGSADINPWIVSSESQIDVAQALNGGYYYVSGGNNNEAATGSSFSISSDFPKGFRAFYAMKHEISEGQWVDFFNSLAPAQKAVRDITSGSGKNSDDVVNRNTVSWTSGNATTLNPERACGYLSWMDLCAYADWAGLRPLSELEYEKICRGPQLPLHGERAWGGAGQVAPDPAGISGTEDGTEVITTAKANCNYGKINFTSGDAGSGPLRCGIFAHSDSNRVTAGAGYYGLMELSGNLWERVVSIGNAQGRVFGGSHGDGVLTAVSGHEGTATNPDWPGIDQVPANGITTALGSGFRGGSWDTGESNLMVSDRSKAALTSNIRAGDYGGRCGRTAP